MVFNVLFVCIWCPNSEQPNTTFLSFSFNFPGATRILTGSQFNFFFFFLMVCWEKLLQHQKKHNNNLIMHSHLNNLGNYKIQFSEYFLMKFFLLFVWFAFSWVGEWEMEVSGVWRRKTN